MAERDFPYHEIKTLFSTIYADRANELLGSGWILLDAHGTFTLGNFEKVDAPSESDTEWMVRTALEEDEAPI